MVSPPQQATNKIVMADRDSQILELRRRGVPYREIERLVGLAKSAVQRVVTKHIEELITPAATELRALELERLDAWQARLELLLNTPGEDTTRVVMALVRLSESRRKLLGLDAPVAVDAGGELLVTIVGVDVEAVK